MEPHHMVAWRRRLRFSRKEAGEQLGLSHHTIKSYETGKRPVPETVIKLMERVEASWRSAGEDAGGRVRILGGGVCVPYGNHGDFWGAEDTGTWARQAFGAAQALGQSADLALTRIARPRSRLATGPDLEKMAASWSKDSKAELIFWMPRYPKAPFCCQSSDNNTRSGSLGTFLVERELSNHVTAAKEAAPKNSFPAGMEVNIWNTWRHRNRGQLLVLGRYMETADATDSLLNAMKQSEADLGWGWTGGGHHVLFESGGSVVFQRHLDENFGIDVVACALERLKRRRTMLN